MYNPKDYAQKRAQVKSQKNFIIFLAFLIFFLSVIIAFQDDKIETLEHEIENVGMNY